MSSNFVSDTLIEFLGDSDGLFVTLTVSEGQLLAAVVVEEGHRGIVIDGPLEVVGGDVIAKNGAGELVFGGSHQGRAGEGEEGSVGESPAHIVR